MPEETPPADIQSLLADMLTRLATLEREVAALRAGRSLAALVPYTPPTDEELQDMLHGPRGQPLRDVIEEYRRECREG